MFKVERKFEEGWTDTHDDDGHGYKSIAISRSFKVRSVLDCEYLRHQKLYPWALKNVDDQKQGA